MQKKKYENCSSCASFSEAERVIIFVKNLRPILLKRFLCASSATRAIIAANDWSQVQLLYMKNMGELQNLTRHALPESHLIEQSFEKHVTDFSVP